MPFVFIELFGMIFNAAFSSMFLFKDPPPPFQPTKGDFSTFAPSQAFLSCFQLLK